MWLLRSDCQLVLNEAGFGSDLCSLTTAVENSYAAAPLDFESEYYLNNASSGSYNGTPTDNTSSQGGNTGTGGNPSTGSGTGTGGTTTGGGSTDPDSGDVGE